VISRDVYDCFNKRVIKRVTSSWSIFIQLSRWCTVQ